MIRQSSSRNQRSKGVRVKHILQIFMLLAVCFWLIYQVKHSHDKRKHFEENVAELSEKLPKFDEGLKLGRKDLLPRDEELSTNHEKIDDEEVEDEETKGDESIDETQEELERKRKEEGSADIEALLEGISHGEEEEDAGGRVGDDDVDEQDKGEGEADRDGGEDVEKDEDNEIEEKDNKDDEHLPENDSSSDDQDHDTSGRNTHETREENYKADDASSAVAHVVQAVLTKHPEQINVNAEEVQEHGESSNATDVGKELHWNATNVLENSDEATPHRLEDVPIKNDTVDSTLQSEVETTPEQNNSTKGLTDDKSFKANLSSDTNATTTDANVEEHDENSNSTLNEHFSAPDLVINSNMTISTNQTESFTADENSDVIEEKTDSEEDSILSSLNDDETLRDPLISEEEDKQRDSLFDLDTLPEIRTEGTDSDDAATE